MNKIDCLLKISDISKSFIQTGNGIRSILKGISFELKEKSILALTGPNGSGKTTLLNIISGDLKADQGSVLLNGDDLQDQPIYQRAKLIGRVNQESYKNLASELTVEEILGIAFKRNKKLNLQKSDISDSLNEITLYSTEATIFLNNFKNYPTRNLSGGERQILAFILAILGHPKLLLLDEHLASMDSKYEDMANKMMSSYVSSNECCVIAITHDKKWAKTYTNQFSVLEKETLKIKSKHQTINRKDKIIYGL
jgi:putative ABC transport system ATP-binding protein